MGGLLSPSSAFRWCSQAGLKVDVKLESIMFMVLIHIKHSLHWRWEQHGGCFDWHNLASPNIVGKRVVFRLSMSLFGTAHELLLGETWNKVKTDLIRREFEAALYLHPDQHWQVQFLLSRGC